MAKVKAPNPQYNGLSANVQFINGVGETDDPKRLDWFRAHGYEVEDAPEKEPAAETDVDKMTVAELKEYAARNDIELGDATKKEDILAAIKGALPAGE